MNVRIRVTEEIIRQSKPVCPEFCLVATAVRPFIKEQYLVKVGTSVNIYLAETYTATIAPDCSLGLPIEVRRAILSFDAWQDVKPFEFDLEIPETYYRG